jgi:hypothetical protein
MSELNAVAKLLIMLGFVESAAWYMVTHAEMDFLKEVAFLDGGDMDTLSSVLFALVGPPLLKMERMQLQPPDWDLLCPSGPKKTRSFVCSTLSIV